MFRAAYESNGFKKYPEERLFLSKLLRSSKLGEKFGMLAILANWSKLENAKVLLIEPVLKPPNTERTGGAKVSKPQNMTFIEVRKVKGKNRNVFKSGNKLFIKNKGK